MKHPLNSALFFACNRSTCPSPPAFINRQRNITNLSHKTPTKTLLFDNEDKEHRDFPFVSDQVCRPSSPEIEAQNMSSSVSLLSSVGSSSSLSMNKYAAEFPEPGDLSFGMPLSPRSKFISSCLKEKINPRVSLILRKRLTTSIELQHLAIGNKVAIMLAEVLHEMPYIEKVDINNNNLTDAGVAAILKAIATIPTLTSLNLSRNKMDDDAADALAEYVQSNTCPLKTLIMQQSDVDDFEGLRFVNQLMNNHTITELDLSDNKIGSAETMRSSIPDLVTCAEAFAEYLEKPSCILQSLKMAWNTIRSQSGVRLARSLALNVSLVYLDLSYNSLSSDGGEALGDALMENRTLKTLVLASNSISSTACFTISVGVIENMALTRLVLDSNPIGEAGAHALMAVPMTVGSRVKVSAHSCNIVFRDPKCWFSHASPLGQHTLDLSLPYERAIAFAIMDLAANHSTYVIDSCEYENPSGGIARQAVELNQIVIKGGARYLDDIQKAALIGWQRLRDAASDVDRGKEMFIDADADGSGLVDQQELREMLTSLGMDVTDASIEDIMLQYDYDNIGQIQLPEFLQYLKSQFKEATSRISDLVDVRVMAASSAPEEKYVPPRQGKLYISVLDGFLKKDTYSKVNAQDHVYARQVASGDTSTMLNYAIHNTKLRLSEAMALFQVMYSEGGHRLKTLANLVVRVDNPIDAKKMIIKVTRGSKVELGLLRSIMNYTIRPILGFFNGYYMLDLSKEMDRICLSRLLEHNEGCAVTRQRKASISPKLGDTSQKQNWSCFRNEMMNGQPFSVAISKFQPMPQRGKLSFDFSSTWRPAVIDKSDMIVSSDMKICKVLVKLGMLPPGELDSVAHLMHHRRVEMTQYLSGKGKSYYENDRERAMAIGNAQDAFYGAITERISMYEAGSILEAVAKKPVPAAVVESAPATKKRGGAAGKGTAIKTSALAKSSKAASSKGAGAVTPSSSSGGASGGAVAALTTDFAVMSTDYDEETMTIAQVEGGIMKEQSHEAEESGTYAFVSAYYVMSMAR
jgi:Ran GTPase-activating protein (RanGAP) involved in mRNA processing and transport